MIDLSAEDDKLNWDWITARREPGRSNAHAFELAPAAWREWVRRGHSVLPRVRRRVAWSREGWLTRRSGDGGTSRPRQRPGRHRTRGPRAGQVRQAGQPGLGRADRPGRGQAPPRMDRCLRGHRSLLGSGPARDG
ncbi:hypothetical protein ACFVUY_07960 [Kitasatospora sp. NPDC058063]|uniref:hypothetical protein n=1 Tax=unclassified Kitasatospora TaxID=2633591 RepID=UPI0036DC7D6B